MNSRILALFFFTFCFRLIAHTQAKQFTDTGYLIANSRNPDALILVFFISSKKALSGNQTPQSVTKALASEKKIALSFFSTRNPVWDTLSKAFADKPIKIRNQSEVFTMKGGYDSAMLANSLLKYKDDYFYVSVIPAIIDYETFYGFSNPLRNGLEVSTYEIKCYGQVIMDSVYSASGHILRNAKRIWKQ